MLCPELVVLGPELVEGHPALGRSVERVRAVKNRLLWVDAGSHDSS